MRQDGIIPAQVTLPGQAINFGVALVKHTLDGFEKRSQEEILYILDNHCKPCDLYKDSKCSHPGCGCNVNNEEKFLNKLAWSSERCPDGKWGPGHIDVPTNTHSGVYT